MYFESSLKMKVTSRSTFFVIMLMSAVIAIQRLLHGNETAQYLQNYTSYYFGQDHF